MSNRRVTDMMRNVLRHIHAWTTPPPPPRIPGTTAEQQAEMERMEKIRAVITEAGYKIGEIYMGDYAHHDEHFSAVFAVLMDAVERMERIEKPTTGLALGYAQCGPNVESVPNSGSDLPGVPRQSGDGPIQDS